MKGNPVLYKTLVVGVIVLFIGLGIQPAFAITKDFINHPPYEPSNPIPPDGAENWTGGGLEWTGGDPDGDLVYYDVYFGNTTPPPQVLHHGAATKYDLPGDWEFNKTYYWKIVSTDEHGASTEGPIWSFILRCNYPPGEPDINGPVRWPFNVEIEFTFSSIDPDGDDVKYYIDWGDGTVNETDYFQSGEIVTIGHTYHVMGTYIISAYAEDIYGALGPTGTNPVLIQRNRYSIYLFVLQFLKHSSILELFLRLVNL